MLELTVSRQRWPMKEVFRIAGHTFSHFDVVVVELAKGEIRAKGEATGVFYLGETAQSMVAQIEAVRDPIESGISRQALRALLPPGGARAAVDAALWDLEAKSMGIPVYRIAELGPLRPLTTTYTVGADTPGGMAQVAGSYRSAPRLKVKLTGDAEDVERLRAIRDARPEAWIGIDANQGLTRASLETLLPVLEALDVRLIEQPLPVGRDAELRGLGSPIPLGADESVQCLADLARVQGIFDVVNIKLDKCGGLTESLEMVREIRRLGMKPMVGCMLSTTLGIAPAFVVGQLCDFADLDAPMFLANDRAPKATYRNGSIHCPVDWGFPSSGRAAPLAVPDTDSSPAASPRQHP